jgi:RimJ/RimL family protein N-acetyltransferase
MTAASAPGQQPGDRFAVVERLRDGRAVEIRAFRPGDGAALLAAIGNSSVESLRFRFFAVKRHFSAKEIASFMDVDFVRQAALVAVVDSGDGPDIVGAGRYIVVEPGTAEIALALVDAYQGLGIGSALVRHLIALAQGAGLQRLVASVLWDNAPMLAIFRSCGLPLETRNEGEIVHLTLNLGRISVKPVPIDKSNRSESGP